MGNENKFWRDSSLGTPREIELSGGPMRVFEAGTGEPIVFVHGALVNANLWRKVVPRPLPRLPLRHPRHAARIARAPGSGRGPLDPYGLADMIAEAVEALGLESADDRRQRLRRRPDADRSGGAIPSLPAASS